MRAPRVVILPHVYPQRWLDRRHYMLRQAEAEWVTHGATARWCALKAKAEACGKWAQDLQHLQRVVARVNAELESRQPEARRHAG